jgi:GT2 family glycosyltransferase
VLNVVDRAPLYIVITDFDGWTQTKECLIRLERSSYKNIRTIVVDHGLTDETAIGLSDFPKCIHLPASSTLWWTGATNEGIRRARKLGARQIMLLNNDCLVAENMIDRLMQHMDGSTNHVIAPTQLSAHTGNVSAGKVWTCFTLGFPTLVLPSMLNSSDSSEKLLSTMMIVGGRGVIVPCDVFEEVGLFDETSLPHYGADHDFYLRCRLNDVQLAIATDATVLIDETRTTLARGLGRLNIREFLDSFHNTRSHRNLGVLKTLFKRYYPVRKLYLVGVFLNIARYVIGYIISRTIFLIRKS